MATTPTTARCKRRPMQEWTFTAPGTTAGSRLNGTRTVVAETSSAVLFPMTQPVTSTLVPREIYLPCLPSENKRVEYGPSSTVHPRRLAAVVHFETSVDRRSKDRDGLAQSAATRTRRLVRPSKPRWKLKQQSKSIVSAPR